jgi:hypothetical protein
MTSTFSLVQVTLQPLSHNCPTESNKLCTRPGNICSFLACDGKAVRNTSLVCDDWIYVQLEIFILSGMCAAYLLVHGPVADKKLLVRP